MSLYGTWGEMKPGYAMRPLSVLPVLDDSDLDGGQAMVCCYLKVEKDVRALVSRTV